MHEPGVPQIARRREPLVLVAIGFGGGLGTLARYGTSQLVHVTPGSFPWATFWTNITGSFALGLILVVIVERFPTTLYLRPFVAAGFLGAYTTLATLAVEGDLLIKDGHPAVAIVYVATSVSAGLSAVWSGMRAARAGRAPGAPG